jgi:hypothetical protein
MRICVAILLIAVATVPASAQGKSSDADALAPQIDARLESMNKQAPIALSPVEKMTKVGRDKNAIIYQIETAVPKDHWTKEMRDKSSRDITKLMCSDLGMRTLLYNDYELRYLFSNKEGVPVTNFVVTKDRCNPS